MKTITPASPVVLHAGMGMLLATAIITALLPGHLPYIALLGLFLALCLIFPPKVMTNTARKVLTLGVGAISAISHMLITTILTIL